MWRIRNSLGWIWRGFWWIGKDLRWSWRIWGGMSRWIVLVLRWIATNPR